MCAVLNFRLIICLNFKYAIKNWPFQATIFVIWPFRLKALVKASRYAFLSIIILTICDIIRRAAALMLALN